jgi:hypothetical protein
MLYEGGERKIHILEIGGHVKMVKSDPKAQRKSSLSDCTWLENECGSFNLETLKFLMHFREPGSSFYFILTHTHIYCFPHTYFLSFFLFLIFSFSFFSLFLSHQKIVYFCHTLKFPISGCE